MSQLVWVVVSVGMAALFIVLAPIVAITGEWSEERSKADSI